jgi:hypothetical protein
VVAVRKYLIRLAYDVHKRGNRHGKSADPGAPAKDQAAPQLDVEAAAHQERLDKARVDYAAQHLRSIVDKGIPVLLLQNPWSIWSFYEDPNDTYRLSRRLQHDYPSLRLIDMRDHLPNDTREVRQTWFGQFAAEKWSDLGHQVYARSILKLLATTDAAGI